jgi:hypothetical protein
VPRPCYFIGCDFGELTDEEFRQVWVCHWMGRAPFFLKSDCDGLFDITLKCDEVLCRCADILKPWRDRWSKMPKRFIL